MAETDLDEEIALAPPVPQMLERAGTAWLSPVRERLAGLRTQGRLPHGLLVAGAPGAGQAELGVWLAALTLCRRPSGGPCGECVDCKLMLAGNHPDFHWVGLLPDKKEIGIDQVRRLSESLSMRSYRGGAKVAVLVPAEAMSRFAFNSLLKTLEEPTDDTYLALAAGRVDRVPNTIVSRCMRLHVPLPDERAALDWLERKPSLHDWPALLGLAAGAPFLAEEYADAGLDGLHEEMQEAIGAAVDGKLDFVAFAENCAKNSPAARLAWLESWLTRSLKEAALASDAVNNNRLPWLRPPGADTKIRAGFGLLDQLRDARRLVGGSLNTQLLFEGLSVSLAALVGPPAQEWGK